jgi:hypothetical protein
VIDANGTASSLISKQNGVEELRPTGRPFSAAKKSGQLFPATSFKPSGALYHVVYGSSGASADFRISASADYIVVQLEAVQGNGIDEITMAQVNVPLANSGGITLGIRWDEEFAVSFMGLSEEVDTEVAGPVISASVYSEFGMPGRGVAIIAVPTARFLNVAQKVESDFHLVSPSPTIGGTWTKLSAEPLTSYLFTDLTEANADGMIRYAKLGGMRYLLVYANTWSSSLGSYPINLKNFPHGEAGLKSVIDKCHAAGLKVGMHMLTSFVGKNDALVEPRPDPGLLKTGQTTLLTSLDEQSNEIVTTGPFIGNSTRPASSDVVIDNEIVHCNQVNVTKLQQCTRGFAGTVARGHAAGAQIQRLADAGGAYLANLRTPLAHAITDRISGLINRVGFDMIDFDGGELNAADGPFWYWVGVQQSQIWKQIRRDLLVQGSGITHWTWHIYSRGICDDFAAVSVKQHLDYHKIAQAWPVNHNGFLAADLGWVGLLDDAPDHPATMPDDLELFAVRSLALGAALGVETSYDALKGNGRSEEMLKMLGAYELLRLSGAVPLSTRQKLAQGEWHMTQPGEFHPVHYDKQRLALPGQTSILLRAPAPAQPLKFRLQVAPDLAPIGNPGNVVLLRPSSALDVKPPDPHDPMPGALATRIGFSHALDLSVHRALAVQLEVEGASQPSTPIPVLNLQLEAGGNTYRDYYIDLKFRGSKTIVLPEAGTDRMLSEFTPLYSNYSFKAAMYIYNYKNVDALNIRWMRYAAGSGIRCQVHSVEALEERDNAVSDIEISAGSTRMPIPGSMRAGDYAEYWGNGPISIFDKNNVLLRTEPVRSALLLNPGVNGVAVKASGAGTIVLTAISLDN